eukprot:6188668-Pleurochrysis_carterae.AAC.2
MSSRATETLSAASSPLHAAARQYGHARSHERASACVGASLRGRAVTCARALSPVDEDDAEEGVGLGELLWEGEARPGEERHHLLG